MLIIILLVKSHPASFPINNFPLFLIGLTKSCKFFILNKFYWGKRPPIAGFISSNFLKTVAKFLLCFDAN